MKKRGFSYRKGYFFLIDSLVALGVLAVGTFLVLSVYIQAPIKDEPVILSEDIMDFFADNKIKDIDNDEVGLGGIYWGSGDVMACNGEPMAINPEDTLLQQVAIFYEKSILTSDTCYLDILAQNFIEELTRDTLPQQYVFEFWMYDLQDVNDPNDDIDLLLYPGTEYTDAKNAAKIIIPSKKMVYGIINQETGDMFGPYNAEVLVWTRSPSLIP